MQLNDDVNRLTSFRGFDSGFNRPQQFNSEFNRPQQFGRETFSEFRDRYVMERGSNFGNQYGKFGNFNNSFETSFGNMGNSRRNPWGFEQQRPQGGFNQQRQQHGFKNQQKSQKRNFGGGPTKKVCPANTSVSDVARKHLEDSIKEEMNQIKKEQKPKIPDNLKPLILELESK